MGRTVANKVRCVQRFEPYPADKLRRSTARNLTAEDPRFLAAWLPVKTPLNTYVDAAALPALRRVRRTLVRHSPRLTSSAAADSA